MPANDVLALNLYYDEWCKSRLAEGKLPPNAVTAFEYFCAEQFLKRFNLDDEELGQGLVGASGDGGIDSFHFFINKVLADSDTHVDRRSENDVEVVMMQIRENKGFSFLALEQMQRFTDDLFDLGRTKTGYRYDYNARLAGLMDVFKLKMKQMAHCNLTVEYYFVTRCDEDPDENAKRAAAALHKMALSHFQRANVRPFNFAGAQRLYDQTKVRQASKKYLSFEKSIDTREGWVGLVRLRKFYEFLQDEQATTELNETIFDDNVRGYFRNTAINRAISTTLTNANRDEPEFWLLNNGITILTPYAALKSGELEIKDPQIVNGLQTSRRIFDYFSTNNATIPQDDPRRILVRVIQNEKSEVRDEIIRATNNQNKMPPEAMISTSRLHKQIEAFFADKGLFYDRRKGYCKDQGLPMDKIVSVLNLVQAVVTILLKKPQEARGRPQDYIVKDKKRWSVFGADDYQQGQLLSGGKAYDLKIYLNCVLIRRRVAAFLDDPVLNLDAVERRNVRFYLVRYAACAIAKTPHCFPATIIQADPSALTVSDLQVGLKEVRKIYRKCGKDDAAAMGPEMVVALDTLLAKKFPERKKAVA